MLKIIVLLFFFLCNFGKLFETVIHTQIFENQHGFFSGRSTVTNLVSIIQFIANALNKSGQVDVIYTDFSKAFDKLDHDLLLKKLSNFGFDCKLLALLSSYLVARRLTVQLLDCNSVAIIAKSAAFHKDPSLALSY